MKSEILRVNNLFKVLVYLYGIAYLHSDPAIFGGQDQRNLVLEPSKYTNSLLSLPPEEGACQELAHSSRAFIKAVHDDAEATAFPTFSSGNWSFPQLDMKLLEAAFGNKRIALIGDSTLFYTLNTLHRVMNSTRNDALLETILHTPLPLTEGLTAINRAVDETNPSAARQIGKMQYTRKNGTVSLDLMWKGFRGPTMKENCQFEEQVWPAIQNFRPQVLVANWGLHLFHRGDKPHRVCNVRQFIQYEEWLQTVWTIAQQVGTRVLLFKTTNFICDEKLPEKTRQDLQEMQHTNSTFYRDCQATLQNRTSLPRSQLERYCREGAMTQENAHRLNERMVDFVNRVQGRVPNMTVAIYNDHDMETCAYAGAWDGLHYHTLQIPRIRLLAHMIQCLWNEDRSASDGGELASK